MTDRRCELCDSAPLTGESLCAKHLVEKWVQYDIAQLGRELTILQPPQCGHTLQARAVDAQGHTFCQMCRAGMA